MWSVALFLVSEQSVLVWLIQTANEFCTASIIIKLKHDNMSYDNLITCKCTYFTFNMSSRSNNHNMANCANAVWGEAIFL